MKSENNVLQIVMTLFRLTNFKFKFEMKAGLTWCDTSYCFERRLAVFFNEVYSMTLSVASKMHKCHQTMNGSFYVPFCRTLAQLSVIGLNNKTGLNPDGLNSMQSLGLNNGYLVANISSYLTFWRTILATNSSNARNRWNSNHHLGRLVTPVGWTLQLGQSMTKTYHHHLTIIIIK